MHFIWDERNRLHLEQHQITPEIAEAVFYSHDCEIVPSAQGLGRYESEGTYHGRTYRLVFTALSENELYPITCFPLRTRRNP